MTKIKLESKQVDKLSLFSLAIEAAHNDPRQFKDSGDQIKNRDCNDEGVQVDVQVLVSNQDVNEGAIR